jgi:hypothetical protein
VYIFTYTGNNTDVAAFTYYIFTQEITVYTGNYQKKNIGKKNIGNYCVHRKVSCTFTDGHL